jgi:histone H3/H4
MENKQKEEIVSTGKHLTEGQYWKWRFFTCNIFLNDVKYKECETRVTNMSKDIEMAKLRLDIYKLTVLARAKEVQEQAVKEYQDLREEIGKELDLELVSCAIDEVSYEVKKIITSK